jgi:hypothetical protein
MSRTRDKSLVLKYRVYYVSIDNILIWMYIMKRDALDRLFMGVIRGRRS